MVKPGDTHASESAMVMGTYLWDVAVGVITEGTLMARDAQGPDIRRQCLCPSGSSFLLDKPSGPRDALSLCVTG